MKIFKKEKIVVDLINEHTRVTEECVKTTIESVKSYMDGHQVEPQVALTNVSNLESQADKLLRDIRQMLYAGAYLPLIRGDIYRLMSSVDKVANRAEDCNEFVQCQRPAIDEQFKPQIVAILDLTAGCLSEMHAALHGFFDPKGEIESVREHAKQVSELESLIDDNEQALTIQIFRSSLDKPDKLHLRETLAMITRISDTIEDASDELQLTSVKSIV